MSGSKVGGAALLAALMRWGSGHQPSGATADQCGDKGWALTHAICSWAWHSHAAPSKCLNSHSAHPESGGPPDPARATQEGDCIPGGHHSFLPPKGVSSTGAAWAGPSQGRWPERGTPAYPKPLCFPQPPPVILRFAKRLLGRAPSPQPLLPLLPPRQGFLGQVF